jgi:4-amino-4-deoxy-L-arabinose transferase-like glycosyltransferase
MLSHEPRPADARARLAHGLLTRSRGLLLLMVLAASALRVGYQPLASSVDPCLRKDALYADARDYHRLAVSLVEGRGFARSQGKPTSSRPPGLPFALAAFYRVAGPNPTAAKYLQAVISGLSVVLVFMVGRALFGRRVGLAAAAVTAIHPLLIATTAWLCAETLYLAVLGLFLLVQVQLVDRADDWRALVAGALGGAATLVRPSHLALMLLVPLWALLVYGKLGQAARVTALIGIGWAVLVLPWSARNYEAQGHFTLVSCNAGYNLWWGSCKQLGAERLPPAAGLGISELGFDAAAGRRALAWIRDHPVEYAWGAIRKCVQALDPLRLGKTPISFAPWLKAMGWVAQAMFLGLAAVGAVLSRRSWRRALALYLPVVAVLATSAVFFAAVRFSLPALFSVTIFASYALVRLSGPAQDEQGSKATSPSAHGCRLPGK